MEYPRKLYANILTLPLGRQFLTSLTVDRSTCSSIRRAVVWRVPMDRRFVPPRLPQIFRFLRPFPSSPRRSVPSQSRTKGSPLNRFKNTSWIDRRDAHEHEPE